MKSKRLVYLILFTYTAGYSQDTILINHLSQYHQGKINSLTSLNGEKVRLKIFDRPWQSKEERVLSAPVSQRSLINGAKLIDPGLSEAAKSRIRLRECNSQTFAGLSRSHVKTSVTKNHRQSYATLSAFLNSLFPDADMIPVIRSLSRPYAERALQEDKFVTLRDVYLVAYARERDNDYHLIITDREGKLYFNAELSGLPPRNQKSYNIINTVRKAFEKFPGSLKCGQYVFFETPIRISTIQGCLFFDTDHPAGSVGPMGARPSTAWELHPVVEIRW